MNKEFEFNILAAIAKDLTQNTNNQQEMLDRLNTCIATADITNPSLEMFANLYMHTNELKTGFADVVASLNRFKNQLDVAYMNSSARPSESQIQALDSQILNAEAEVARLRKIKAGIDCMSLFKTPIYQDGFSVSNFGAPAVQAPVTQVPNGRTFECNAEDRRREIEMFQGFGTGPTNTTTGLWGYSGSIVFGGISPNNPGSLS